MDNKKNIPVVTIDSGIPVPEKITRYPLDSMEVGDSFSFSIEKRASVQSAASLNKRTTGKEFKVKKMDSDTCRVWRIK